MAPAQFPKEVKIVSKVPCDEINHLWESKIKFTKEQVVPGAPITSVAYVTVDSKEQLDELKALGEMQKEAGFEVKTKFTKPKEPVITEEKVIERPDMEEYTKQILAKANAEFAQQVDAMKAEIRQQVLDELTTQK